MKKFIFALLIVCLLFFSGCATQPSSPDLELPKKQIPFDIYKYLDWNMIMSSKSNVMLIQHSYYDKNTNKGYVANGHGFIAEGSDGKYYVWTAFHVVSRQDLKTVNYNDNFLGVYRNAGVTNVYILKPIAYEKDKSDIAVMEIISVMSPGLKEAFPFEGGQFSKKNEDFSHVFNLTMALPYVGTSSDESGYVSTRWSPIESSPTQPFLKT